MGLTSVTLEIKNAYRPKKTLKGQFLVDSGAMFTVLTEEMVRKLELKPEFEREFSLADGTTIKRKVANAFVKYQGIQSSSPVILGEKEDSPLLGVLTLEALGLALDPLKRKLYPAKLTM